MSVSEVASKKPILLRLMRLAALIVVQVIVTVLLLEIGLRVAMPFSDGLRALLYLPTVSTEFDAIPDTKTLLRKSTLGYHPGEEYEGFLRNSHGFRTPEYQYARSPEVLRVVVLGDSFASDSGGVPWRWMWPTLLEQQIKTRLHREVEVINLGVPAVGPRFLLRLWELEGRRLNPDLVILSFFVGNDFTDEFHEPLRASDPGELARLSVVYRLGRNGTRLWKERKEARRHPKKKPVPPDARMGMEIGEQSEPFEPTFSVTAYFQIESARLKICETTTDYFEKRFAASVPILRRLNASVNLAGAELAVMVIPDEFQINPKLFAVLAPYAGKVDVEQPQRRLAEFLEQENIPHLDLLPAMQSRRGESALYLERDSHWNREGNRMAAEELASFLTGAGLVFEE